MDTDINPDEVAMEEARAQQIEQAMREAGQSTEMYVEVDYFDFAEEHTVYLPGSKTQFVQHRTLNESARRDYMNQQNREVRLQKSSGDAILKMATGKEQLSLLRAAVCGWNLVRKNSKTGEMESVPYSDTKRNEFFDKANPVVIDAIMNDIRKHNPWLLADVTIEDIDKQIEELNELRANKVKEAEGKES